MGDSTKIQWADKTFNPWTGCQKISPGCDNCYAESWAKRTGNPQLWNGARRRTTADYWRRPAKWNREAAERGVRYRVFCASLADVFDNEVDPQWRADLWDVIAATPNLEWLVLTKRIGNALAMLPAHIALMPNVWLGITVVNQEEADRDVPKLLRLDVRGPRWLSIEPMLGPIDLAPLADFAYRTLSKFYGPNGFDDTGSQAERDRIESYFPRLDWIVCGGESGSKAKSRPLDVEWCTALREQCVRGGAKFFMKQGSQANWPAYNVFESFPEHLRVREFPR